MATVKDYWKKREAENLKKYTKQEADYNNHMARVYSGMLSDIEKEINAFYAKYARDENITMADAKRKVAKFDVEAFSHEVDGLLAEGNLSEAAEERLKLYKLTMNINRLELLKAQIGAAMVKAHEKVSEKMSDMLTGRAYDEIERQAGIFSKNVPDAEKTAKSIASSSFHNATFSERVWNSQDILKADIERLLQQSIIQGLTPEALAHNLMPNIRKEVANSRAAAERLLRTEMARVQTGVQAEEFKANGFEQYQFLIVRNDNKACSACRALDGNVFKVRDMEIGENAPPIHPNCRCSIAPWEDNEEYEKWIESLEGIGDKVLLPEAYMDATHGELTDDERGALNAYISSESYRINEKLRKGLPLTDDEKQFKRNLDYALTKMPRYQGFVYRRLDANYIDDIDKFNEEHSVGNFVMYDAYTSAAADDESYMPLVAETNPNAVITLIIHSLDGADIRAYNSGEQEIVFKRNSMFYVQKREGNTIWLMEVGVD